MKSCIWLTVVAVIGAGAIGTDVASRATPDSREDSASAPASAAEAARQVFAAGVVEGAQRDVSLQFELVGRITAIPVREGQAVRAGEVCAQLDDALWQHQLREAEAALELARADLQRLQNGAREETRAVVRAEAKLAAVRVQQALVEELRADRLFKQKALAGQDHDRYRFDHERAIAEEEHARARVTEIEAAARADEIRIAQAKVELAAAAVEQARTLLERASLRAPIDGVILRIDMEPGELVATEQLLPVVTMTSLSQVRVRAYVEELDALSLQPGAAAYVTVAGKPDVRYSGRVTWAAPVMGPKSQRHHQPGEMYDVEVREVLIVLDDGEELVVGLPVDVFISAPTIEQTASESPITDDRPHNPAT